MGLPPSKKTEDDLDANDLSWATRTGLSSWHDSPKGRHFEKLIERTDTQMSTSVGQLLGFL